MQKREDLGADDVVGVYLDTFHDRQRAYFFFSSPLGIQGDGVITETSGEDFSFDTQWDSRGKLTDDGYVVLITVPFKALRFPVKTTGSQEWGLALVRTVRSNNETDYWPGNTQRVNGFIAQFATADGIADVSPGRNIQIIPYGTFTGARFLDADTSAYERTNEGRAGVDVKLVPRDAVTLDFTINPDFSQVESDEPQVTVNQRFEVFFPEKRPFFLENSDFFASPLTLFFSRRVRDPQFGARMTGKYGKWATGALVIDDRAPGHEADPASPEFEDRAVNVVGSVRRDFANQSNVGFMGTSHTFAGSGNQVAGGSTHLRLDANWFLDVQAVGSHDTDLEGARHDGAASVVGLNRNGRSFNLFFAYTGVSPDFRVPLGFVPRTDIQDVSLFWNYRWHPKSGPLTDWGPNSFVDGVWNYAGDLQDWNVRFPVQFSFKKRTNVFYRHALISETVSGLELAQREDLVQVSTSTLRWLSVDANLSARHAAQLLSGERSRAVPRRLSGSGPRCPDQAGVEAVDRRDAALEPARWPRRHAGRGRRHLREPHRALAGQLPVHARVVAARDPRLQLGRVEPLGRRSRARPALRHGHPPDVARASRDGALHRLHRRLRQRGDRSDAPRTVAGRGAALDRPPAVRQIELAVPVLIRRPEALA